MFKIVIFIFLCLIVTYAEKDIKRTVTDALSKGEKIKERSVNIVRKGFTTDNDGNEKLVKNDASIKNNVNTGKDIHDKEKKMDTDRVDTLRNRNTDQLNKIERDPRTDPSSSEIVLDITDTLKSKQKSKESGEL